MGLLSMARAARSKSTRDTDSTSAGAEAQPPIPAECFECSRCMEACSNADLAPACKRGGKTSQSCWRCLAAYKGLTRRWRKNRKLQTWFQQKTAGEKAEWYKQHKTSMAGQRNDKGRRIIEVHMESFQEKKHSAKRRIHWKPFHIYRRDLMASGVTDLNQVQAMWRADLMNSANKRKKVAGQWCIGEFLGEIEDFEEAEGNRSSVDKKQVAEDEQEMSELIKELGDTTRASASVVDAMLGEVMAFPSGDDVCDIADEYVKDPITTVSAASLLGFDTLLADMAASDDMVSKLNELYLEEELDAEKCALPTDDRDESMLRSELLKLVKVHLLKVRGSLDEHDLEAEHISSHVKAISVLMVVRRHSAQSEIGSSGVWKRGGGGRNGAPGYGAPCFRVWVQVVFTIWGGGRSYSRRRELFKRASLWLEPAPPPPTLSSLTAGGGASQLLVRSMCGVGVCVCVRSGSPLPIAFCQVGGDPPHMPQ